MISALERAGAPLFAAALAVFGAVCFTGCGGADREPEAPYKPEAPSEYEVAVAGGRGATGGGSYAAGATVSIYSGVSPNIVRQFKNWATESNGVIFANANGAATTFTMPANDVTVTAVFDKAAKRAASGAVGMFIDGRDSKKYRTVTIDDETWMAENLNYDEDTDNSWCYEDNGSNCGKYGRLYNWEAALAVCPLGWHLPNREEWDELLADAGVGAAGAAELKTDAGWESGGNGADAFGFSALPGGSRAADGSFKNAGNRGLWWTAAEFDGDSAYYRRMGHNYDYVYEGTYGKGHGFSVRCVSDERAVAYNAGADGKADNAGKADRFDDFDNYGNVKENDKTGIWGWFVNQTKNKNEILQICVLAFVAWLASFVIYRIVRGIRAQKKDAAKADTGAPRPASPFGGRRSPDKGMNGKKKKMFEDVSSVRRDLVGALIFGLGGLGFIVFSVYRIPIDSEFKKNEVAHTATVTDVEYIRASRHSEDGDTYTLRVKYVVDNKVYYGVISTGSEYSVGNSIAIYYNRNNPSDYRSSGYYGAGFMFLVLGLVFFLVGTILVISGIRKRSEEKELLRMRHIIRAEFERVEQDESAFVNSRHPFIIHCKWTDGNTGAPRLFQSRSIWPDPAGIIEERRITTFPVYTDPKDPKRYYVSLEELE
ncbi:MAG: DUF3592 domain-containing protein [Chitinispirillales bacterium]|jgi:uncharacterized protein (TIGR02145 family)|nr:DUF3592 domain-containing protein [Chitinispirillales bacterium]